MTILSNLVLETDSKKSSTNYTQMYLSGLQATCMLTILHAKGFSGQLGNYINAGITKFAFYE